MTRFALKSLAVRKFRTVLTALAIVLGVAMISGTYVLTDTIDKAFSSIFEDSYAGTDVVVSGKAADISVFGDTPDGTAQLARQFIDLGLTAAKFGWGPFGKDAAVDVAHVAAARDAWGYERDLMVDAGHAWTMPTALERAKLLAPFRIGWLEEPLSQDDRKGYAALCPQSPVPIAAGEGDVTHWDFEDLIERGVHVIQPDVAFCGGLTVCKRVSAMTEARGRRAVPHCFSTGINLAASLHWMASVPGGDLVEYCLRPSPLMRGPALAYATLAVLELAALAIHAGDVTASGLGSAAYIGFCCTMLLAGVYGLLSARAAASQSR